MAMWFGFFGGGQTGGEISVFQSALCPFPNFFLLFLSCCLVHPSAGWVIATHLRNGLPPLIYSWQGPWEAIVSQAHDWNIKAALLTPPAITWPRSAIKKRRRKKKTEAVWQIFRSRLQLCSVHTAAYKCVVGNEAISQLTPNHVRCQQKQQSKCCNASISGSG